MANTDTLLDFPCPFSLKVMGKNSEDFEKTVYTIVHTHIPYLTEGALQTRTSKKGTYMSITVAFQAENKAQLDGLYQALSEHDDVIMAL